MKEYYIRMQDKIATYTRKYSKDWNLFEKLWLLLFTGVNIYLYFAWQDNWVGLLASLTGMLTVVLVAKGKISSYYFGFVNIFAYSYVAYQNRYFGEVMLNLLYFFPMQFVGLYYWIKNRNKNKSKDDVLVKSLDNKERLTWLSLSIVGIYVYGLFLTTLGNTLPYVDSTTTILSVVATILMVKRTTDQWILWIVVDIVSIFMWVYILLNGGNDVSIAVMWSAYLVNAIYGYYNWRKLEKRQNGK